MSFDAKFFTLLAFIIINFLILFLVKTRTTTITSIIIAHLVAVLFFSLSISNYNSFKEIVLALIIYSMVVLFLISNYDQSDQKDDKTNKIKDWRLVMLFKASVGIIVILFFISLFSVTKNITKISEIINEKKFNRQNETMLNPMLLPSHEVHIAVKKFYLGKKFEDNWSDKVSAELEMNEKKRARLKDTLSDNFLLKRSSDVILIIVAVSTSLLLLARKKNEEKT